MSLRGSIDGELRRLGNALRGTDRGSAEFHDDEHSSTYWATLRARTCAAAERSIIHD
jgi:hypothetical protein